MMERVKWYRNASEKDQDNEKGKGTMVAIMPMQNNAGGTAVIVKDDGNIVEKELSLIKVDKEPVVDTTALQKELQLTIDANKKISDDLNALQNDVDKAADANIKLVEEIKDLRIDKESLENLYHDKINENEKLVVEVEKLKAKTKVKPVKK